MDEDVNRSAGALGCVDVEPLDGGGAIGITSRSAQTSAHHLAVGGVALDDLLQVRRVNALVIGGVELSLVHVEPHARPLDARSRRRLLSNGRTRGDKHGRGGTQKRAARKLAAE